MAVKVISFGLFGEMNEFELPDNPKRVQELYVKDVREELLTAAFLTLDTPENRKKIKSYYADLKILEDMKHQLITELRESLPMVV